MWQSEPIKTAQLNEVTLGNWQVVRMNLTDAVIPYYIKVQRAFPDTSQGAGKLIEEQGKRISTMLGLLGRMEGRGVTPLTWKELEQLDKLWTEFRTVHKQVGVWVQDSIPLQKGSEKAIKDLPISREDKKVAGRVPSGGPGGLFRTLGLGRSLGLGVMGAGGHAVQAALKPMLGPLAGPLMAAVSTAAGGAMAGVGISRYLKRRKARRMGGPALPGISPGVAGMAIPGIAGTGIVEGMPSTYPRDVRGRFTRRGPLTGIDNIEKALFKFFNRRALKAKWTRRLLRAAEKGAGKKGAGGGLLDSFAKLKLGIGGVLGVLGGAGGLKAAGLVGAIAFTTVQLYRAGKVAIEWYNVHKNAAKSIKKQTDKQQELLQNLSDTLWEKGQKAKAEGDEPARRGLIKQTIRIQAEKLEKEEKPGMWETIKSGAKAVAGDVKRVANFRDGGVVTRPTLGVIAEEQPEVVTPLSAGNVMDVLKAIKENTAKAGIMTPAPMDTFMPPFDLADPLLNQLNTTGSLG